MQGHNPKPLVWEDLSGVAGILAANPRRQPGDEMSARGLIWNDHNRLAI